jgi:peptidoglycan/LPS O-acetylase OafA/YrhL
MLTSHAHVAATTAAFAPDGSTPPAALPLQALLLQGTGLADKLTWNTPSWSISVEFWTYIVFALVVTLQTRHQPIAFAVLAAAGATVLVAFARHGMDATYDLGLARCIFGFFVGCLVYWARQRRPAARLPNPERNELIAVAAIVAFVSISGRTSLSFAAPLIFAAAVYIFSFEAGPVSRLLTWRPFQNLGRWSYSIYMVQALIVFVIGLAVSELQRRLGVTLWKNVFEDGTSIRMIVSDHIILLDLLHVAYVLVVIAVAAVTYRWIEEPGRRYFQQASDKLASSAAVDRRGPTSVACQTSESR